VASAESASVRKIRVFHCDDSRPFTRLCWFWLSAHSDIEHVGEAHTLEAAFEAIAVLRPDVVLLDTMGAPSDTTALHEIRARAPGARVVVLSGYVNLMPLGGDADAYVAKGDDEGPLLEAIRLLARSGASGIS
jgi:DNA-binding NarL/FixJ family response regulator